jgi:hypothetical protein
MNRFQRPAWTTGSLIPASFLCGIASAVFIWRGGQKTKRTKEVSERLRAALDAKHPEEEIFNTLSTPDNVPDTQEEKLGMSIPNHSCRTDDSASNRGRSNSVLADIDEEALIPRSSTTKKG